jgi:hypothetical protein
MKHEKILVYELEGKEHGKYDLNQVMDIEVEEKPDESDEEISDRRDRIVLAMKNGEKQPISTYWYSSGHHLVVRSLRYALGFESCLHVAPDMQEVYGK